MDLEDIYADVDYRDIQKTTRYQTRSHDQDERKDQKSRKSRCWVLITVSLGLICVLLLIFIILQHITITAERDLIKSYKNTAEEFNQTINRLQHNYTDLMTQMSQKTLELETRVNNLTAEKDQLKTDFASLNMKGPVCYFMSGELKSWSDTRQYCRDHGGDLVIIDTEEKQRFIFSLVKDRVWIGLSDTEQEGHMKWVDNSTLKQGFWFKGEPNDAKRNEDCIELNYQRETLNSWNDRVCAYEMKGICEK